MYLGPRPYHPRWQPTHPPRGFASHQWRGNTQFNQSPIEYGNTEQHWCETCDRGFPTADQLDRHKQQHQKCNIDGCQFIAHPKVITKHIQMQHSSGLYKKIAKLNNPEEIQKWREERKKKYPTRLNIEKKAAESKEKIDRGEKMALKYDNNNRMDKHRTSEGRSGQNWTNSYDQRNTNNRRNQPDYKRNNTTENNNKEKMTKPPAKKARTIPTCQVLESKIKPFAGILSIADLYDKIEDNENVDTINVPIEDDDYEKLFDKPKNLENNQEAVVCGALSSLMCDYGSSDDEHVVKDKDDIIDTCRNLPIATVKVKPMETNKPEDFKRECLDSDINNLKSAITNIENLDKVPLGNKTDDDSGPEEVKVEKSKILEPEISKALIPNNNKEKPAPSKRNPQKQVDQRHHYRFKHKIPSTLLQKLLHKEIRQERNIILQCIRYIRKHDYFDKSTNQGRS